MFRSLTISQKSTLGLSIKGGLYPGAMHLNYDNDKHRKLMREQKWSSADKLLVFDELHKMPKWKSWVKGIYDVQKTLHNILVTGSARLDVYRKGGDSLQGRYHYWHLHPFSIDEYPTHISFDEALDRLLTIGGFPEPFLSKNARNAERWRRDRNEGGALAHTARRISFTLLEEGQGQRLEQAFGTARFAYNWALAQWEERRGRKDKNNFISLRNALNNIKKESFPQGPRSLGQSLDKLARANKSLHRKEKGSKNRRKASQKVACLHTDIANIRRDFTEKLSTQLLKKYDIIGIEDLNVSAMMKSGRTSRSLADASLGALVGALERKQTKYGALVIQVDRFFPSSQLCRKCQVKNQDLTLGDRIFRCVSPTCQHQEDRLGMNEHIGKRTRRQGASDETVHTGTVRSERSSQHSYRAYGLVHDAARNIHREH